MITIEAEHDEVGRIWWVVDVGGRRSIRYATRAACRRAIDEGTLIMADEPDDDVPEELEP